MEKDPPDGDGNGGTPPKPRQTFQAGFLRQLKENAAYLADVLTENAGSSNKSQLSRDQAKHFVAEIDGTMRKMVDSHRIGQRSYEIWKRFMEKWRQGTGSWTSCEPLARSFNESLQDLDP
jgi:hypothetical protein